MAKKKNFLHVFVVGMNQNDLVRWQLDEYVVLIILGQKIVVVLILWGCANHFATMLLPIMRGLYWANRRGRESLKLLKRGVLSLFLVIVYLFSHSYRLMTTWIVESCKRFSLKKFLNVNFSLTKMRSIFFFAFWFWIRSQIMQSCSGRFS